MAQRAKDHGILSLGLNTPQYFLILSVLYKDTLIKFLHKNVYWFKVNGFNSIPLVNMIFKNSIKFNTMSLITVLYKRKSKDNTYSLLLLGLAVPHALSAEPHHFPHKRWL